MLIKRGTSLKKSRIHRNKKHAEQCEVSVMNAKGVILVQVVSKIKKNHYKPIETEFLFLASE